MNFAERREKIMRIMYRRGYETVENLARECEVSKRTMMRDIGKMMNNEPIYTQSGRYGGGVYLVEGAISGYLYLKNEEIQLLEKAVTDVESNPCRIMTDIDIASLNNMILIYTKPKIKR